MNVITVKPNQSLADVVIMACGTMEGGMQLMMVNNQSISDTATTGQQYEFDATLITSDAGALQYLQQNGITVGTK